jgi:hypothetical protein
LISPQPVQIVAHQQQRAYFSSGADRRGVQPGERGGELVELSRRLQFVLAAEGSDHALADSALVPVGLDELKVDVGLVATADLHTLGYMLSAR